MRTCTEKCNPLIDYFYEIPSTIIHPTNKVIITMNN